MYCVLKKKEEEKTIFSTNESSLVYVIQFKKLTLNIDAVPVGLCKGLLSSFLYIIACSETFLCTQPWIYSQILLCPLHFRI